MGCGDKGCVEDAAGGLGGTEEESVVGSQWQDFKLVLDAAKSSFLGKEAYAAVYWEQEVQRCLDEKGFL